MLETPWAFTAPRTSEVHDRPRIVAAIWERSLATAAASHPPTAVALVALGGYGRRELAPHSDLDLLVLHEKREPGPFVKLASERFLYALWDLRLEVGYGIRDIHACDELAASDQAPAAVLSRRRASLVALGWARPKVQWRRVPREALAAAKPTPFRRERP